MQHKGGREDTLTWDDLGIEEEPDNWPYDNEKLKEKTQKFV